VAAAEKKYVPGIARDQTTCPSAWSSAERPSVRRYVETVTKTLPAAINGYDAGFAKVATHRRWTAD
jgi:hypothetical protein